MSFNFGDIYIHSGRLVTKPIQIEQTVAQRESDRNQQERERVQQERERIQRKRERERVQRERERVQREREREREQERIQRERERVQRERERVQREQERIQRERERVQREQERVQQERERVQRERERVQQEIIQPEQEIIRQARELAYLPKNSSRIGKMIMIGGDSHMNMNQQSSIPDKEDSELTDWEARSIQNNANMFVDSGTVTICKLTLPAVDGGPGRFTNLSLRTRSGGKLFIKCAEFI
jgi:chromosome segregation ATPase